MTDLSLEFATYLNFKLKYKLFIDEAIVDIVNQLNVHKKFKKTFSIGEEYSTNNYCKVPNLFGGYYIIYDKESCIFIGLNYNLVTKFWSDKSITKNIKELKDCFLAVDINTRYTKPHHGVLDDNETGEGQYAYFKIDSNKLCHTKELSAKQNFTKHVVEIIEEEFIENQI